MEGRPVGKAESEGSKWLKLKTIESREERFETHLAGRQQSIRRQKLRLSIARAVVKQKFISSTTLFCLDYKTDAVLRRRLKVTGQQPFSVCDPTVGTIMDAIKITVLDRGEIVRTRRHEG